MRSFSDDDTEFEIVVAETSEGRHGVRRGEPTGEVRCVECGRVADVVEEIPHRTACPQRGVVSRWWERTFVDER